MEHNYLMNLAVPLVGIAPLFIFFILRPKKKTTKKWTRPVS
ncbi:Hypothetical protein P9211_14571 [Prochlorococcus marinus str. MIT 9211]|uniref:Uncharacterized protein n=1 Tax=Prochlorococcus marinus (strain MIT 9211) TaxID=93059 RepID=A9BC26_PROM4|nr:Hypothetical protein P9211_14571 [Prochlorococcus marinus str. MIT 9211]